jgi:hypothetical protein
MRKPTKKAPQMVQDEFYAILVTDFKTNTQYFAHLVSKQKSVVAREARFIGKSEDHESKLVEVKLTVVK